MSALRDLELLDLHLRGAVAPLPLDDALQRVERDRRLEHAREIERRVAALDPDLAAVFRGLEPAGEPGGAREGVLRDEPEIRELGGRIEARRRIDAAGPAQPAVRQRPARREARKIGPDRDRAAADARSSATSGASCSRSKSSLRGVHAIVRPVAPGEREVRWGRAARRRAS